MNRLHAFDTRDAVNHIGLGTREEADLKEFGPNRLFCLKP